MKSLFESKTLTDRGALIVERKKTRSRISGLGTFKFLAHSSPPSPHAIAFLEHTVERSRTTLKRDQGAHSPRHTPSTAAAAVACRSEQRASQAVSSPRKSDLSVEAVASTGSRGLYATAVTTPVWPGSAYCTAPLS